MKKALLFLIVMCTAALPLGSRDRKQEKDIDRTLSRMTLDEKIGQMILLEINQVTYYRPEFEFRTLMTYDRDKLEGIIREAGLEGKYNAATMLEQLDPNDVGSLYAFYLLSRDLCAADGFSLDPDKLRTVFGEYHVGSLLNMLGGTEASSLGEWRKAIGEMEAASLEINGIPLLYGLDQVHGPTYIAGGTLFPQQIGMAATFNATLVKELGTMNAYETRAGGVRWCYGPSMDLSVRPSWARFYETWGEDPLLTAVMAGSYMQGLQGPDPDHLDPWHVAACLKHYMGYSAPDNGMDRTPATVTEQDLREKHFEPFRRAALTGALSMMTNSSVVNGQPGVCNRRFLTEWLKEGLDWDGVIVTDWGDTHDLCSTYRIVQTEKEAIALVVNAGVDLLMVPSTLEYGPLLKELVEEGTVPLSRIDDAVRRILRLKYRAGLFDRKPARADYPLFGSEAFARKAYKAALESEVLLKNEGGVLPLPEDARILVCGPNADTMRGLNGGWSYTWQGSGTEKFTGSYHTILEALQQRFSNIVYEPGVEYDPALDWTAEKASGVDKAVKAAAGADYIVCCVGENSYAETQGTILDQNLSDNQKALVRALAGTGKPVILVLNEGRPRLVRDIEPAAAAVVDVLLPGNYGGDALAALLAGDENFSGRLPFTYPAWANAFTTYSFKVMEDRSTTPGIYNYENHAHVQWWFGEGLSYTTFAYEGLSVDRPVFRSGDVLSFQVDVTNTGSRPGKEAVLLFASDDYASLMPDNRRLRAFTKIELAPGETRRVTLEVPADELAFVGTDGLRHLEKGAFTFLVGGKFLKAECAEDRIF
ncbi:MAG: glycoside hydrolase family 3 C-terminal domain-containing protein [Bacteroidales bacterium]|nr:glycoside hydrolase family 3 C-terminal domain-containing protein [Bacteroidales bacterium]